MSGTAAPPIPRSLRMARGIGASSVAALVALALHVAAGGSPPPAALVALTVVLCWPVAFALIGPGLSLVRQALVIGVAQLALHGLFSLEAGPMTMSAPGVGAAGMPGMPGMGAVVLPAVSPAAAQPGGWMWAAHAVAAVLTVLVWNRGERAVVLVLGIADAIRRVVVPRIAVSPGCPPVPRALLVDTARPAFRLDAAAATAPRRGPPAAR